jgi:tetratricopeptide (TPR) repeat protein
MTSRITRIVITAALMTAASCIPGTGTGPTAPASGLAGPELPVPETVTDENLALALRRLQDLEWTSEQRALLRTSIVHQLSLRFERYMADDQEEKAYDDFEIALSTFSTEEILAGEILPEVASMARSAKDRFSPVGDEAKVMVALLVLQFVDPDDEALEDEYEMLSRWTEEAREGLKDEAMRIIDLVSLYEEVAMSVPVPQVTDRLLELYKERRLLSEAAYEKMLDFDPSKGIQALMEAAEATQLYEYLQPQVRRTSYLVARLFTRIGTPTTALLVLERDFGDSLTGSMQNQVHVEVLLVLGALEDDPGHPGHWLALARLLARNDDLEIARWSCRRGWRLDPSDATFPLEIGLLYRADSDLAGAREYLELALTLDDDRAAVFLHLLELYRDQTLDALDDGDGTKALETLERMAPLLKRFEERWPNAKSDVTRADLEQLKGLVAFQQGQASVAASHFEKALEHEKDIQTFVLLGRTHMLSRDYKGARAAIDWALKLPFKKHGEAYYWKSMLLTLKGDVFRLEGDEEKASELWRRALDTGMEALPFVPLHLKAEMEARLGLLLHRLGRTTPAIDHLKRSIAGGATRETYVLVLSYLTARGDLAVSDVYYHFASTESKLPLDDQLTFTTWYVSLHWREQREIDDEARSLLEEAGGEQWPGPLMRFVLGSATAEETMESAGEDPARLAPVLFLHAMRLLGEGDVEGARTRLEEVLDRGSVADPHYAMALEALGTLGASP